MQMASPSVQNFIFAEVSMSVAIALVRGFARTKLTEICNFWESCDPGRLANSVARQHRLERQHDLVQHRAGKAMAAPMISRSKEVWGPAYAKETHYLRCTGAVTPQTGGRSGASQTPADRSRDGIAFSNIVLPGHRAVTRSTHRVRPPRTAR